MIKSARGFIIQNLYKFVNLTKKERKDKVLYLGLSPNHFKCEGEVYHHPIIRIIPLLKVDKIPQETTHIIFTSKTAVLLLLEHLTLPQNCITIAIGKVTAETFEKTGAKISLIAKNETQEGVVDLLQNSDLSKAHIYFPHSALSRTVVRDYLISRNVSFTEVNLYDTVLNPLPLPNLTLFDKIVFTSSSTVHAFFSQTPKLPPGIILHAIGPITQKTIDKYL